MKLLRIRIKELDSAIALLEQQRPEIASSARPARDMKTLVVEVLEAAGPGGMSVKDIVNEIVKQGRDTKEPSVASTLSRLRNEEKVQNHRGQWIADLHIVKPQAASEGPTNDHQYEAYGFSDDEDLSFDDD